MPTPEDLPDETICRIVDCLGDYRRSLKRLARTNRRLCRLSRTRIWDTFSVCMVWWDPACVSGAPNRIRKISERPELCSLIRDILIDEDFSRIERSEKRWMNSNSNSDSDTDHETDDCSVCWGWGPDISTEEAVGWYRSLALLLEGATTARSLRIGSIHFAEFAPTNSRSICVRPSHPQ